MSRSTPRPADPGVPRLTTADAVCRIARAIPALREATHRIVTFRPLRLEVRSELSLEGELTIVLDGGESQRRFVQIRRRPTPVTADERPGSASDEASMPPALVGQDGDLEFAMSPFDPALPALGELMAGQIDGEPRCHVCLLSHRFGRRATVLAVRPDGSPFLVKHYARGDTRVREQRHPKSDPSSDGFRIPSILGANRRRRLLHLEYLPGETLGANLRDIPDRTWAHVGSSIAGLGTIASPASGGALPAWCEERERSTIKTFAARVARIRPSLAEAIMVRLGSETTGKGPSSPTGAAPGLVHRDLHDGQILTHETGLSLIDWDLSTIGPPELDLGNLSAHLWLRAAQDRLTPSAMLAAQRALIAGWSAALPSGCQSLVRRWERLALLRLAGVYGLRPEQEAVPPRLLRALDDPEVLG